MNITTDNTPLVFYNEETERARAVQRAREEEAVKDFRLGQYEENPYMSRRRILEVTDGEDDKHDELERAREHEEKNKRRRRKTRRSAGNFGLDILAMLILSRDGFSSGLEQFLSFLYLGWYKSGQDAPGKNGLSRKECRVLCRHKRNVFWGSIFSLQFLKDTIVNIVLMGLAIAWLCFTFSLVGFKHPLWSLWAFAALVILWNAFKVFLVNVLDVMEHTCGVVLKRKEERDTTRKNAEAAEEKARKLAEDARRAREAETENNTDSETEETPTTDRFAEFFT